MPLPVMRYESLPEPNSRDQWHSKMFSVSSLSSEQVRAATNDIVVDSRDHWHSKMFSLSADRPVHAATNDKMVDAARPMDQRYSNIPFETSERQLRATTKMAYAPPGRPPMQPMPMPKKTMPKQSMRDALDLGQECPKMPKMNPIMSKETMCEPPHLLAIKDELDSKLKSLARGLDDASTTCGTSASSPWSSWNTSWNDPIELRSFSTSSIMSPLIPIGAASTWSPFGLSNSTTGEGEEEEDEMSHEAVAAKLRAENHTTIMLRSLPNRVSAAELSDELCELGFTGRYDMCLIPKDRHSGRGRGYGFVNFLTSEDAAHFCEVSEQRLFRRGNGKQIYVAEARLQGRLETLEQIVAAKSKKRKTAACLIIRLKDGSLVTMPTLEDSLAALASEA